MPGCQSGPTGPFGRRSRIERRHKADTRLWIGAPWAGRYETRGAFRLHARVERQPDLPGAFRALGRVIRDRVEPEGGRRPAAQLTGVQRHKSGFPPAQAAQTQRVSASDREAGLFLRSSPQVDFGPRTKRS